MKYQKYKNTGEIIVELVIWLLVIWGGIYVLTHLDEITLAVTSLH